MGRTLPTRQASASRPAASRACLGRNVSRQRKRLSGYCCSRSMASSTWHRRCRASSGSANKSSAPQPSQPEARRVFARSTRLRSPRQW
eukprot:8524887-Alexandrium_andersonii.AAC.1